MVEADQASWINRGECWLFKLLAFSSKAAFFFLRSLKNLCNPVDHFYSRIESRVTSSQWHTVDIGTRFSTAVHDSFYIFSAFNFLFLSSDERFVLLFAVAFGSPSLAIFLALSCAACSTVWLQQQRLYTSRLFYRFVDILHHLLGHFSKLSSLLLLFFYRLSSYFFFKPPNNSENNCVVC